MNKTFLLTSLFLLSIAAQALGTNIETSSGHLDITLSKLQEVCLKYPENANGYAPNSFLTIDQLTKTTQQCTAVNKLNLNTRSFWQEGPGGFVEYAPYFTPYAQRIIVKPESNVYFFGDLHGNIHSLLRTLSDLKKQNVIDDKFHIIKPDTYLVFLGDYVDRGEYGVEVIYALMRLRMINSQHVILIRGNHEDVCLNNQYGFRDELYIRINAPASYLDVLAQWYATMPAVLFVGVRNGANTDYIQCCHGGPELGYNADKFLANPQPIQFQLIGMLNRADNVRNLPLLLKKDVIKYIPEHEIENIKPTAPTSPITLGLMWADLIEDVANYKSPIVAYNEGRGWVHGKELTHYWFKQQSGPTHTLHAIIRGHQHYGDMLQQLIINKGLVSLWDNTAYTVLSAPVAGKQFPYDAYTHLKTATKFADWSIKPVVV